ncbi:hypothetical protein EMIHUDRAFT_459815, partial [Emiliania huxleyi CCMP1516]|uniref:Uncharacterized protein n=2 Tax=Emiliania huxleyi TaxID=2903 RepID=A0A0D3IHR6_EMIH1
MGDVILVAVEREGGIKWEPREGIEAASSREAKRRQEGDEAQWLRKQEHAVVSARVAEAKEVEKRERARKAAMLGSDSVYRGQRSRGPLAARAAGMHTSAPRQYAFIKESLNALEAAHAAKEHAARQEQYERIRRRHKEEFKRLALQRKERAASELAEQKAPMQQKKEEKDRPLGGGAVRPTGPAVRRP